MGGRRYIFNILFIISINSIIVVSPDHERNFHQATKDRDLMVQNANFFLVFLLVFNFCYWLMIYCTYIYILKCLKWITFKGFYSEVLSGLNRLLVFCLACLLAGLASLPDGLPDQAAEHLPRTRLHGTRKGNKSEQIKTHFCFYFF